MKIVTPLRSCLPAMLVIALCLAGCDDSEITGLRDTVELSEFRGALLETGGPSNLVTSSASGPSGLTVSFEDGSVIGLRTE